MRTTRLAAFAAATALVGLPLAAGPAGAAEHDSQSDLTANLTQLNDSGASGTAWAKVDGNQVWIKVKTEGQANAPHAQHVHIGGQNMCPSADMQGSGPNGALTTKDAAGQYGAVKVSLTKEPGKTGAGAALDVPNFPKGDSYTYTRTVEVSDQVAHDIKSGNGVVVTHGVDLNGSGKYDGEGKSSLDPKLPLEATAPSACGPLDATQMAMPEGGAETGGTGTAGMEYPAALGLGAIAIGLGGAGFAAGRLKSTR